jgi:hypothetical protein
MAFRLRSVAQLYSDLGMYDAIVEFTELAVRAFIIEGNQATNFNDFIAAKSIQHGITVNSIPQDMFRARISQSYILSVYQTAEGFFHQFKTELQELEGEPIKLNQSNDDFFTKLVSYVAPTNEKKSLIGTHRLALFNYYRIVRNKYSHDFIADKQTTKAFEKLKSHLPAISADYSKLQAPNPFDKISFDDFILFSRLVKDIADRLNDLVKPIDDKSIIKYYNTRDPFPQYAATSERKKNAMIAHINDTFGLDFPDARRLVEQIFH